MITTEKTAITVIAEINLPVEKVWEFWTNPKHIVYWNNASDDWCTPNASNDLKVGGKIKTRMEARDGSMGFDFEGEYTKVENQKLLEYVLGDGRKVQVLFTAKDNTTTVTETFDAENVHPAEMQQAGWQAILNNFKYYAEKQTRLQKVHMEIVINALPEKVYNIMLNEKTYKEWTAEFNPTSHFVGSWDKGSKILFVGTDEQGNKGGMVSRIKENIKNRYVCIEHLGILKGEEEITSGAEVEEWKGCVEEYTFREQGAATLLSMDVDSNEAYKGYFEGTWPKALSKLKSICEK